MCRGGWDAWSTRSVRGTGRWAKDLCVPPCPPRGIWLITPFYARTRWSGRLEGQARAGPRPRPPGRAAGLWSSLAPSAAAVLRACPRAAWFTGFKCTMWVVLRYSSPYVSECFVNPKRPLVPLAAPCKVRVPSAPSTSHSAPAPGAYAPRPLRLLRAGPGPTASKCLRALLVSARGPCFLPRWWELRGVGGL